MDLEFWIQWHGSSSVETSQGILIKNLYICYSLVIGVRNEYIEEVESTEEGCQKIRGHWKLARSIH